MAVVPGHMCSDQVKADQLTQAVNLGCFVTVTGGYVWYDEYIKLCHSHG
jgi:hypothetical protein